MPRDRDAPMIGVFGARSGDSELEALAPAVRSGWMGLGRRTEEFEAAFRSRLGRDFAMTSSGSSALQLLVASLDLPAGSEIVVPAITWVACAHAVLLAGHVPVLADVDVATQNIRVTDVEAVRTDRTAAVMVVHYAGKPAPVAAIEETGLPVIEDAAHAVDSVVGGRFCGTLGSAGMFSFDSIKNIATPDGGGITARSEEVMARARALRNCGIGAPAVTRAGQRARWWEHGVVAAFPRSIPNDVSASVGLAQLERLSSNQARRHEIWSRYQSELADLSWLGRPVDAGPHERHSFFTYLVRVLDGRRDELATHLLNHGVYTTLRYQPLHRTGFYRSDRPLPNAERIGEEGLNLPLHPRLSDRDQDRIVDLLREF